MHVAAVEALRKEEVKLQFITKIGGKTSLGPSYFVVRNFISSCAFRALL
jgi:hypothetical protein